MFEIGKGAFPDGALAASGPFDVSATPLTDEWEPSPHGRSINVKSTSLAMLPPLCLCLLAGSARASLAPYSFGASENLQHQSNVGHTPDDRRTADWISITEFNAAIHQPLGRDALVATAAVDISRYKHSDTLDSTGYQAAAQFDWSTIGDLSGSIGADSQRHQYVSGEAVDLTSTSDQTPSEVHNLQTDNHAFARLALGGESRWRIYGGVDANDRRYSNDTFQANDERQWSTNAGTRYATSPDLSFGLGATYVHGEYPHAQTLVDDELTERVARFNTRSFGVDTRWQAGGSSLLTASVGYTTEDSQAIAGIQHFVNGALNWNWTPPSHISVNLGVRRSADADASTAAINVGVVDANNLNGTSINNEAHLDVVYSLTAKTSLDASADYSQRKYSDVLVIASTGNSTVSGTTRTTRLFLTAHFQPTRTVDLGCGGGREIRHADAGLAGYAASYSDNYLQCVAAIHFD